MAFINGNEVLFSPVVTIGAGGSGDKLYRHDLRLFGDWYSSQFEIFITIFNTDPTDYTIEEDIDIDDEGQEYPLGIDISKLNFLPKDKWIPCTGCYGTMEGDFGDNCAYAIRISSSGSPCAEVAFNDVQYRIAGTVHYGESRPIYDNDTTEITDTVTEICAVSVAGGSADLSNYYTKSEVDDKFEGQQGLLNDFNTDIANLFTQVGEISTALDEIIALQDYYTGATFDELHEYATEVAEGGVE